MNRTLLSGSLCGIVFLLSACRGAATVHPSLQTPQTNPNPSSVLPGRPAGTIELPPGGYPQTTTLPDLRFTSIQDNRQEYPAGKIPAYARFELDFQLQGSQEWNPFFSFDPNPPPGIDPDNPAYQGISVDAEFSADGWQTIYRVPAFFYQEFEHAVVPNGNDLQDWLLPTSATSWKVRFAPTAAGPWQARLVAQGASGSARSEIIQFEVAPSASAGFVRASSTDERYFATEQGDYFPALGLNAPFDTVSWTNPTLDNTPYFEQLGSNGIQVLRVWLSQWTIFGSAWNPWNSIVPGDGSRFIPFSALSGDPVYTAGGSETAMIVNARRNPCMFAGWLKPAAAVRPQTNYRIRVRYHLENLSGPAVPALPSGLVIKTGGWLWGDRGNCGEPGVGEALSSFSTNTDGWQILEGSWYSGENYFLPYLYLVMENLDQGRASIDRVWLEAEDSPSGQPPNLLTRSWMSHHLYVDQRQAFAFDLALNAAEANGVTLRLVLLEKEDWLFTHLQADGTFDSERPDPAGFYGSGRQLTKGRWLQQAWWRYAQARWGYSTAVFAWELLNEGDPGSQDHYALADEFGRYMHCTVFGIETPAAAGQACLASHPNAHLVTTSFWTGFPGRPFWTNPDFPNLDFADVHAYVSTGWLEFPGLAQDAAAYHLAYSADIALRMQVSEGRSRYPVTRGEAGLDFPDRQQEQPALAQDRNGVWLHNFLWSTLDGGALHELYWWQENIVSQPGPDGEPGLYEIFGYLAEFLQDIPLDNGFYQPAAAESDNESLRIVGQVDAPHNRAHLWVQNTAHTWQTVVAAGARNEEIPAGLSGTIRLKGLTPGQEFSVEFYAFTTVGIPQISTVQLQSGADGSVLIRLPDDPGITDAGIKLYPRTP